jgi:iron complex transport system substrate-binding protein
MPATAFILRKTEDDLFYRRMTLLVAALLIAATGCGTSTALTTPPTTSPPITETATSATTPQVAPAFPVTITAANGAIEIPARPTRIVSMSATHTEMLYAIGAGDQVVAVDAFSNYPAEAPVTDLTGFAPNVEAIVELDTDLVVTDGDWDGTSMGALTELGIPVLILPAALTLDEVYAQIEQLGAATDQIAAAAELVSEMKSEIEELLAGLPSISESLTFYHELDATFYSVTSETFIGHVYSLMGLTNIADAVGDGSFGYPQLSEEYILETDPDLIFLADTLCCDMSREAVAERPGWNALSAVQNDAVVELDDDVASRWGPRVVELMQTIATATSDRTQE